MKRSCSIDQRQAPKKRPALRLKGFIVMSGLPAPSPVPRLN